MAAFLKGSGDGIIVEINSATTGGQRRAAGETVSLDCIFIENLSVSSHYTY